MVCMVFSFYQVARYLHFSVKHRKLTHLISGKTENYANQRAKLDRKIYRCVYKLQMTEEMFTQKLYSFNIF